MAKSTDTFSKREKEKKRLEKRKEKEQRKEDRKASGKENKSFEDMLAYVDENGNLTSTPPDQAKKRIIRETEIDLTSRNKGGATSPHLHQGTVKFYDTSKGFGFIKDDQTSEEFFFHHESADSPVAQLDRVTFETGMGHKGPVAIRISKVSAANGEAK